MPDETWNGHRALDHSTGRAHGGGDHRSFV